MKAFDLKESSKEFDRNYATGQNQKMETFSEVQNMKVASSQALDKTLKRKVMDDFGAKNTKSEASQELSIVKKES